MDLCLFFTKQQTEDFTSGNFNPGDCLAQFVSCDRGVSILSCMSMSLTQQEKYKSRETAEGESKSNHSLTKALQLRSNDPPAPPTHYQEFKLLLGTFAGLLVVLFGPGCDYYTDVFGARMILADEEVAVLVDCFTPLLLRQYV